MKHFNLQRSHGLGARGLLAAGLLAATAAVAGERDHSVLLLTSTNDPAGNAVIVFKLESGGTSSLSYLDTLPTGGKGGASTNAGILQFRHAGGAVANFGSNSVTELIRDHDFIGR
jgi:hypothetical protein